MRTLVYFTALYLFFCSNTFAQLNKISGEIEYLQIRNTVTGEKKDFYTLHFNGEESYFEENIYDKQKKRSIEKSDGTTIFQPRDYKKAQYYYLDSKGSLYFSQFHINEHLFVKENDKYNVNWNITGETKKIGKFVCQKALGEFRGRTYYAWFAPEIALGFGPWKLNGLPGLILEAGDLSGYISFAAKRVVVLSNNRDSSDYIKMRTSELNFEDALSINDFLNRKEEIVEAYFERLSARLPKGVGSLKLNKDCKDCGELWEKFD